MLNLASIDTYGASGIEQWEWLSEDDDRTCPACDALDGQHLMLKDGSSGGGDDDSDSAGMMIRPQMTATPLRLPTTTTKTTRTHHRSTLVVAVKRYPW